MPGRWLFGYHPRSGYGSAGQAAIHRPWRSGHRLPAARCCGTDPLSGCRDRGGQPGRLFVLPAQGDGEAPFGSWLPAGLQPGISVFSGTPRRRLLFWPAWVWPGWTPVLLGEGRLCTKGDGASQGGFGVAALCSFPSPLPAAVGWVPPGCFVSPAVPRASFFSLA